jgi:hypothetical protein
MCPQASILIRGACFDKRPNPPVLGVKAAADRCAAKGGYLPKPLDLYAARGQLPLGSGNGVHSQFTDSYSIQAPGRGGSDEQSDEQSSHAYAATTIVNEDGLEAVVNEDELGQPATARYEFICTYRLIVQ